MHQPGKMSWIVGFERMKSDKKWPLKCITTAELQKKWDSEQHLAEDLSIKLKKYKAKAWEKEKKLAPQREPLEEALSVFKQLKELNGCTLNKLTKYYEKYYESTHLDSDIQGRSTSTSVSSLHRIFVVNPSSYTCISWEWLN